MLPGTLLVLLHLFSFLLYANNCNPANNLEPRQRAKGSGILPVALFSPCFASLFCKLKTTFLILSMPLKLSLRLL